MFNTLRTKKSRTAEKLRTFGKKIRKNNIFILLTARDLQTKNLVEKKKLAFYQISVIIIYMIKKVSRIDLIRKAHAVALAEKGDIELEGVLSTDKGDVLDEAQHLDALDHVEQVDVDADENLVDMEAISPAMRDMFTS